MKKTNKKASCHKCEKLKTFCKGKVDSPDCDKFVEKVVLDPSYGIPLFRFPKMAG